MRPSHYSLVRGSSVVPYIRKKESFGDLSDGGTPGYIPNPVVKAVSADGTWSADSWESRSLPKDFFCLTSQEERGTQALRRLGQTKRGLRGQAEAETRGLRGGTGTEGSELGVAGVREGLEGRGWADCHRPFVV